MSGKRAAYHFCACRVLDGPVDELRVPALDTIASLAVALGPDFPLFAPTVRKVRAPLSGQTEIVLWAWAVCT